MKPDLKKARSVSRASVLAALSLCFVACQRAPVGEAPTTPLPSGRPTLTLESEDFVASFDVESAALARYVLRDPRFQRAGHAIDLVTTNKPQYLPLGIKLGGQLLASGWHGEQLG